MENINKVITIQTYIRKWLSTSIYPRLSNNTHIKNKFEQEINSEKFLLNYGLNDGSNILIFL